MELGVSLEQNQILAPRMEQSVRILQMDSVQLGEYLKELALENPVAEVEPPPQREQKEAGMAGKSDAPRTGEYGIL